MAVANKRWQVQPRIFNVAPEVVQGLQGYRPMMRQLLYNRRILDLESAAVFLKQEGPLYDPKLLKGMDLAVDRLLSAIENGEAIVVYGDYDVDGVTATLLLVEVLRCLGGRVSDYIPSRFEEGYGLNNDALDTLSQSGVSLVVTVDCGIRSPDETAYAQQKGMDIIISDHHEPRSKLPQAVAILCPKQEDDPYPEKNLAGVGLAFKIAQALLMKRPVPGRQAEDWLDLVAIGTIVDLVPLIGENRSLVRAGLKIIRAGQRPGLRALVGAARINLETFSTGDASFGIGPRLNAAGRLESAKAAYQLLAAGTQEEAGLLAQKLDDQNRERQNLTEKIQKEAEFLAQKNSMEYLLFAVHPDFNMGVVGLAASKLTELYYRPSVVGYMGEEFTRASCRSIPEFHITHALDECATLLVRHGGHAVAAGFTVRNENLPELELKLRQIAERELSQLDLSPALRIDMEIPLSKLKGEKIPEVMEQLGQIEPTGLGNPEAVFVSRNLLVLQSWKRGMDGKHLALQVKDGAVFDAIAFRQGQWFGNLPNRIDLVYSLEWNYYKGEKKLQLRVRDLRPSGEDW